MSNSKTILIILDGWGHGDKSKSDAIFHAKTPYIDFLYKNYPNSELLTDGEKVGLPNGQMGNSEVGHLNIGAGRIVDQDLVKINKACSDNSITTNKNLQKSIQYVKENNSSLHIMGLVSDGGIHSHIDHLYKLIDVALEENVKSIYLHAFTDGRDCDPNSGRNFIKELTDRLNGPKLATVCGRYYAMDRDKRWERIKKSYDAMVYGIDKSVLDGLDKAFGVMNKNLNSEFGHINLDDANKVEREINQLRNQLKRSYLENAEKGEYKFQSGILYNDIFSSCEKIGDHIINVSEAVAGEI